MNGRPADTRVWELRDSTDNTCVVTYTLNLIRLDSTDNICMVSCILNFNLNSADITCKVYCDSFRRYHLYG